MCSIIGVSPGECHFHHIAFSSSCSSAIQLQAHARHGAVEAFAWKPAHPNCLVFFLVSWKQGWIDLVPSLKSHQPGCRQVGHLAGPHRRSPLDYQELTNTHVLIFRIRRHSDVGLTKQPSRDRRQLSVSWRGIELQRG